MNAVPRRLMSGINADLTGEYRGDLKEVGAERGTVIFECEVRQPPSMEGRTIYVWFTGEDLTDALKVLRDEAIRVRSEALKP